MGRKQMGRKQMGRKQMGRKQIISLIDAEVILFSGRLDDLKARLYYDPGLRKVWEAIEANYADAEFGLEAGARTAGFEKNNLNRVLRRYCSMTFYVLLTKYRLYLAVAELFASNRSILAVAESCGLSQSSFDRNARKYLGAVPRDLKESYLRTRWVEAPHYTRTFRGLIFAVFKLIFAS
jgi:AraC-like DNA-binding protein